jgi:hypothetical protein
MTKEPRKSSASVNRHCRAALRGSEGRGNGNQGAERAPQCGCPVSCHGAVVVRGWLEWVLLVAGRQLSLFVPVLCHHSWVRGMCAPPFSWAVVVCGWLEWVLLIAGDTKAARPLTRTQEYLLEK